MDTIITGVIVMQSVVDGTGHKPTKVEVKHLRDELEKAGFQIIHVGMLGGVSVEATRALIKATLGLDLPDPPFGSHQHLKPTIPALSHLTLLLEIYAPINHDI